MSKFVVFRHALAMDITAAESSADHMVFWRTAYPHPDKTGIPAAISVERHRTEADLIRTLTADGSKAFAYMVFADEMPDEWARAIARDDAPLPVTFLVDKAACKPEGDKKAKATPPCDRALMTLGKITLIANPSDIVYQRADAKKPVNYNSQTTPCHIAHGNYANPLGIKYVESRYSLRGRRLPWARKATLPAAPVHAAMPVFAASSAHA